MVEELLKNFEPDTKMLYFIQYFLSHMTNMNFIYFLDHNIHMNHMIHNYRNIRENIHLS